MLLLYLGEGLCFDHDATISALRQISGIQEVEESDPVGSVFCCRFDFQEDTVLTRLSADLETVSIHGQGLAAQELVVRFRAGFAVDFHLIDEGYTFDEVVTAETTTQTIEAWLA